jgi:hypothetical protein
MATKAEREAKGARDAKAQRARDAKAQRDAYRKERHCAPNADYSQERQAWAVRHCCCPTCDPKRVFSNAQFKSLRLYKMGTANGIDRWVRIRAEGQSTWVIASHSGHLWSVPGDAGIEKQVRLDSFAVTAQKFEVKHTAHSSPGPLDGFLTEANMRQEELRRSLLMEKHVASRMPRRLTRSTAGQLRVGRSLFVGEGNTLECTLVRRSVRIA